MIIIGIGANLSHPEYGVPRRTCGAALSRLTERGLDIVGRSFWYESAPVLAANDTQGDQPWYVNAAIAVNTERDAHALLQLLLSVEEEFGRVRSIVNAPRTLDLDIVAFHDQVIQDDVLDIPHPRLDQRAFVLLPIKDIAPKWQHPVSKMPITTLVNNLPEGQDIRRMSNAEGAFATEWQL